MLQEVRYLQMVYGVRVDISASSPLSDAHRKSPHLLMLIRQFGTATEPRTRTSALSRPRLHGIDYTLLAVTLRCILLFFSYCQFFYIWVVKDGLKTALCGSSKLRVHSVIPALTIIFSYSQIDTLTDGSNWYTSTSTPTTASQALIVQRQDSQFLSYLKGFRHDPHFISPGLSIGS